MLTAAGVKLSHSAGAGGGFAAENGSRMMRRIACLRNDCAGGAGARFVIIVALVAMPVLYPSKTLSMIDHAQASWEHVWTIDGLSGGRA